MHSNFREASLSTGYSDFCRGENEIMPEIKILGDSPTTKDGLGFDSYVDILLEAINKFDVESPLTIGIHGRWGSGKTSLMRMLEERFEKDKSVKTIWFNAWRYSKEDIIWRAFIMKLLYKLGVFQNLKGADWLQAFGELIKPFFSSNPNLGDIKEAFSYGKRIDSMDEFEEGFKKIVRAVVKDGRLIIFIDDLDRCLPEKTIEILEVIKLFLDVPRCVFIIGVEKEVIEQGIKFIYKSGEREIPISGRDYIEKIIQIPFTLPPIREEDMTRFIGSLGIGKKEKDYAKIVAKVTGCNPRKVKTFLNTLRIRQIIAERTGEGIKPELFVKLYATEYTFPEFYKDVVKYKGDFLCTLERLAKGDSDEGLREKLDGSLTLQTYYKNEKITNLLKDKPFFYEIEDIEPYIYLSGAKAPEEVSGFDEPVLEELSSGDWVKMQYAANKIKKMPDLDKEHYVNAIIPKLEDKNGDVREGAAGALGMIGDANAVDPLTATLLKNDEIEVVRTRAAGALGMIGDAKGDAKAVEALIEVLSNANEIEAVRKEAIEALGKIGNPKAVEPLISALKDEDGNVRWKAVDALGMIGGAKAAEALIRKAADDEYEPVNYSTAEALVRIGAEAVEPLMEALEDENSSIKVRYYAALVLGRIGDVKAKELLEKVSEDKDNTQLVRRTAKNALKEIEAKQNKYPLQKV